MTDRPIATPLIARVLLLSLAAIVASKAVVWTGVFSPAGPRVLVDFDAFHLVGQMVWRGDIAGAYDFRTLMQVQVASGGRESFMPWTYPPPFNLVVAALACLPVSLAYLLFIGLTLGTFLFVLRRLAGRLFSEVLLALFPAIAVCIASGQNGFLTGALIGATCLALLRDRGVAGLPLGLMVIKPHLAVAFALYVVATRRWACLIVAAATSAAAAALATVVLGGHIWTAFLHGVAEAGEFLAAGYYPLSRMVSVYAALRSVDVPASLALIAQGAVALFALGLVVHALRRGWPKTQVLGLTALASLLVSPYAYDYDLPLLGIALALLMPDLIRLMTYRERIAFLALSWMTGGYGLATTALFDTNGGAGTAATDQVLAVSLAGPLLLLLVACVLRVLQRERAAPRAAQHPASKAPLAA